MAYPNKQDNPAAALPVRLVDAAGGAFYTASGGGGGGSSPPYPATPLGYQQITSLAAAAPLTIPGTATFALVQVEGADVRWRDDGTAPTSAIGMLLTSSVPVVFSGDLSVLQFIQAQASSKLNVSYYK